MSASNVPFSPETSSPWPQYELRTRRKELNLTQRELADLAGVSPRFIHELENGKATLRLDRLLAVADALGLEPAWHLVDRAKHYEHPDRP